MIKIDDELFQELVKYGFTQKDSNLFDVLEWLYHNYKITVNVFPEYSKSYEMLEYRVKIFVEEINEVKEYLLKRIWFERPCDAIKEGILTSLKYIN